MECSRLCCYSKNRLVHRKSSWLVKIGYLLIALVGVVFLVAFLYLYQQINAPLVLPQKVIKLPLRPIILPLGCLYQRTFLTFPEKKDGKEKVMSSGPCTTATSNVSSASFRPRQAPAPKATDSEIYALIRKHLPQQDFILTDDKLQTFMQEYAALCPTIISDTGEQKRLYESLVHSTKDWWPWNRSFCNCFQIRVST